MEQSKELSLEEFKEKAQQGVEEVKQLMRVKPKRIIKKVGIALGELDNNEYCLIDLQTDEILQRNITITPANELLKLLENALTQKMQELFG